MPLNGIESLFACRGNSGLSYGDFDEEERPKKASKKSKLEVHPSKAVKLREMKNSVRPKETMSINKSDKPSDVDAVEEWTRIRNMERRREIQSLKQQNNDLKKELDTVQDLLITKKGQVDALKRSVNNSEDSSEDGVEEREQEIARLQTLELTFTELQQKHQLLLKEKEQILNSLQKVKMEKENAEKQLEALKKEKEKQTMELQQTSEELEKGKKEIENLYKMYEGMLNDKESERLSIENENKMLIRDLMVRCKSVEALSSARQSPINGFNDLDSDDEGDEREDSTEIPRKEMIELIANLEFEKSKTEEELENAKIELQKQKTLCESFKQATDTTLHDKVRDYQNLQKQHEQLLQELSLKNKKLEENQSTVAELTKALQDNEALENSLKDSEQERNSTNGNPKRMPVEDKDTISKLQQKLSETQTVLNQKNAEIFSLSAQIDECKLGADKIQRELQTQSGNLHKGNIISETINKTLQTTLPQQLIERDEQHREEINRITSEFQTKVNLLEEQLSHSKQQKQHVESVVAELQEQLNILKTELADEKQRKATVTTEQQQKQPSSSTSSTIGNKVDEATNNNESSEKVVFLEGQLRVAENELMKVKMEKKSLEENLEKEMGKSGNMEKQFKVDINEYQKQAELQEDVISKSEYDIQKLKKRTQELHETIDELDNKLHQYTKENLALMERLEQEKQQHETLKANHETLANHQDTETELLLQCREEELDEYKNRLESQEIRYEALLKNKEDEISMLEKQIANVQNELELKLKELKHASAEHEEFKRKTTENDRMLRDEQEAYLINEIERQQSEFKSQIAAAECDKEKYIYQLTQQYEEKIINLEAEYDQIKSNEIEILKDDQNTRFTMITMQRDELLETIKKLETLLLQQKYENDEKTKIFQEIIQRKNDELIELEIKENSHHQQLLDAVTQTIADEESIQDGSNNKELIKLLEKLQKKLKEQPKNGHLVTTMSSPMENGHTRNDVQIPWPPINDQQSPVRRLSLNSLQDEPNALQEQIKQTKEELATKMKELNEQIALAYQTDNHTLRRQQQNIETPWSDSVDGGSICSDDLLQTCINNGSLPEKDFQNITDYFSTPSKYTPSINHFQDSGVTECSTPTLYKNQLQMVTDTFSKLETQCFELNKNSNFSHEKWYKDLEAWKHDVNNRLKVLRHRVSNSNGENHDDVPLSAFSRSIVYRPTTSEVKAIIESVNKQYERFTDEY